jgi:O-antigen ligase
LNAKIMTDKSARAPSIFSVLSSYILFAVIAGAPFPFGSDNPSAIAFWCIVLGFAAFAVSLSSHELRSGHFALLGGIAFIVLCYCFVLHEQLADHPWIATPHPVWEQASKVLGIPLTPSVSITRGEPFFAVGASLACVLALICGLIVGNDRHRAHQLLQVMAWSGAAYAAYGVLSFLIEPTMILWREKRAYLGSVTGTFINRNTAAAYFGSCAVVWFTLFLDQVRRHLRTGPIVWKKVPQRILSKAPRAIVVSFSMLFVCLMAMFLTGSRGGVVLSLFALIITFTVFFRNDLPRRTGVWIALGGGVAVALVLLQFMGGVVSNRFDVQGLADEGRFAAYRSTLRMIADHPWFGTGLGTFAWSFPAYRSPDVSMWGVWDIAHNTPLELASEVGLPLAGAVCLGWVVMLAVLIRGIRTRRRDVIIPLAAFAVTTIAVLHSCIDFSLQIPGYSIVVFALVGAGLSQSFGSKAGESAVSAQGGTQKADMNDRGRDSG